MNDFIIRGQKVPPIGLGTWLLSGNDCVRAIEIALSLGYRHIDTAQIYDNEEEIGIAIQNSNVEREEIFVVTKISTSNYRYENAILSTEDSLENLRTSYIDLLLMHWPNFSVPLAETLDAMNVLKEKGKIKHIGLSNFPPSLVKKAFVHSEIFCNQIEYHPYLSQHKLVEQSSEMDYLITAYCPIAKGRVLNDETLKKIGEKYLKSPAQVTLRWLFQQGINSIPKSSSESHLRENLDIFDFELSEEEMNEISKLERGLHLDPVSHMAND